MAAKTAKELWTIAELADRVGAVLADGFSGVANGRVRDVPDLRAIRYYTTIGLLNRPAEMRGRTAYYGRRHLCQLVAIKRLQAQGLSLAQIQQRLLPLADRELEKLAVVKSDVRPGSAAPARNVDQPRVARREETRLERREDFWKASPAIASLSAADENERQALCPGVVTLVSLAAGLSVGVEACRAMTAEDVAALRAAAEPVRQILLQRRLIRPDLERENHDQATSDSESR